MAANYFIDEKDHVRFSLGVPDTAKALRTSPENIYALIDLDLIQALKLSSQMSVSLTEIQRFADVNAGKDLKQVINDAKQQRKINQKVVALRREG